MKPPSRCRFYGERSGTIPGSSRGNYVLKDAEVQRRTGESTGGGAGETVKAGAEIGDAGIAMLIALVDSPADRAENGNESLIAAAPCIASEAAALGAPPRRRRVARLFEAVANDAHERR